jgi:hypothetical protein
LRFEISVTVFERHSASDTATKIGRKIAAGSRAVFAAQAVFVESEPVDRQVLIPYGPCRVMKANLAVEAAASRSSAVDPTRITVRPAGGG